ncbi:MAG: murein biosynthesis integral membrane protein MurJ [Gammaproteobacteria bacterium]|nr:murein biosynthesis integral membrane protein MurJ [Gammaproteobacteria bacterium]
MTRKLLQSTALTGAMTLVSRITGLIRDMAMASLMGAGASVAADAFYVAFRIPNFLRRIFGEGALSQAFVPVFAEYRARKSPEEAQRLIDNVTGVLSVALFAVTLIGVVVAPLLVWVLAPGFAVQEPQKYQLTVAMLRVMFPYLFFISLVALAGGILNTLGKFGVAAFTPVLLNLALIGAALWLAPYLDQPAMGLAWGVFIAGVAQLLFQIPYLRRVGLLPRPRFRWRDDGVSRVMKLMLPGIFGVSVAQINLLVNTVLASFLVTGSVSWLYYADRVMEFPIGVFGIALGTVVLPQLSQKHASASVDDFSHLLDWGLRLAFIISIPACAALIVLAGPIVITLFHHGKFDANDVTMSVQALIAFLVGLVPFILIRILAPGFYARHDTATPARVGVYSLITNIVLSLLFVYPLAHTGLALATSIAAVVNAGLLYRILRQQGVYRPLVGWSRFFGRVGVATVAMAGALTWGVGGLEAWLSAPSLERAARLAFWILVGSVVYGAVLLLSGMRPAHLKLKTS